MHWSGWSLAVNLVPVILKCEIKEGGNHSSGSRDWESRLLGAIADLCVPAAGNAFSVVLRSHDNDAHYPCKLPVPGALLRTRLMLQDWWWESNWAFGIWFLFGPGLDIPHSERGSTMGTTFPAGFSLNLHNRTSAFLFFTAASLAAHKLPSSI